MTVQQKENDSKGQFYIEENGKLAAAMYYVYTDKHKFIIDHTEVMPEWEGKGLGKLLVKAAVDFARQNEMKIIPLCPYASHVFKRHLNMLMCWYNKAK